MFDRGDPIADVDIYRENYAILIKLLHFKLIVYSLAACTSY